MRESTSADNKQGTPSQEELAWLAGFMDGEGYIGLNMWSRKRKFSMCPRVTITNTDKPTIEYIYDLMHRMGVGAYIYPRNRTNPKHATAWDIIITRFSVVPRLLIPILPYLKTKRKQAETILDFIIYRQERIKGASRVSDVHYGPEEMAYRDELSRLNQKGTPQRLNVDSDDGEDIVRTRRRLREAGRNAQPRLIGE
jgi:hypothetical protein